MLSLEGVITCSWLILCSLHSPVFMYIQIPGITSISILNHPVIIKNSINLVLLSLMFNLNLFMLISWFSFIVYMISFCLSISSSVSMLPLQISIMCAGLFELFIPLCHVLGGMNIPLSIVSSTFSLLIST